MSNPMTMIDALNSALTQEKYALHVSLSAENPPIPGSRKQILSVPEVMFMQNLLRDRPEVFSKIQGTVDSIMADGKVDIFDVPQLIHLCSQIYHEHVVSYVVHEVGVISLIRFTVDALLDSGILPVHGVAKDVIKKVVDTSLELLRANVTVQSVKSCWDRFFRCGCTGCTGCTGCKGCRE
jgi:hypothetical protein